jgi:hypothetical protein
VPEPTKPNEVAVPKGRDELAAFLKRTQSGDKTTLPVLRKMLEDQAFVRMLGGERAEEVERSFVGGIAAENLGWREAITRKLDLLRAELLGDSPTPVERLLVERVVACWLQVQDAELRYAQGQNDLTMRQGDYCQRRMDAAHRRYLSALKTLALVRKLAVPVLQVNIAKRQLNVTGGAVVTPAGSGSG